MRPVITPDESGRLDAAASDPVGVLMERAGLGVALAAVRAGAGYGRRVVVLAGPGNNGGDGYVAARHLVRRGATVVVHALGKPRGEAAEEAAARAEGAGARIVEIGPPEPADLIVDALFGAGFRGQLPDEVVPWTEAGPPVVAVDVPSGLDAADGRTGGPAFRAAVTVTFHALKVGHLVGEGPDRCGEVRVVDIGLTGGTPELLLAEEGDAPRPPRPRAAHKWSAGSVLVVGGSPGITGAPLLAARSALHFGAGAVAVACPGDLQDVYAALDPGVMTVGIGGRDHFAAKHVSGLLERAGRFRVLALGPGLGKGSAQEAFVQGVAGKWEGPLVVDADAIGALGGPDGLAARPGPTVITPHAGEFARLTGSGDEPPDHRAAAALAGSTGAVVVLKGNPTIVAGRDTWVVASGGPELASIGTGDVLTGMTAALWSRGLDPETAARSAVYWHGKAGASLSARTALTATGLVGEVGRFAW